MEEEYKNNDPEKLIFRKALDDHKIEPSEKFWSSALPAIGNKGSNPVNEPTSSKEEFSNADAEKQIFRKALDKHEIEPSEKFWNTALHNIINKEGALRTKQVRTWKLVSAVLATVIAAFCVHEVMLYNKMDKIEQQVSELKNAQKQLLDKANTQSVSVEPKNTNVLQPLTSSANPPVVKQPEEQAGQPITANVNKALVPKQMAYVTDNGRKRNKQNNKATGNIVAINRNNTMAQSNVANNIITDNDQPTNTEEQVMASNDAHVNTENQLTPADKTTLTENNKQDNVNNPVNSSTNAGASTTMQVKDRKADSVVEIATNTNATANTADALPPIEQASENKGVHNFSISTFFTPGILSSQLHDNDNNDAIHAGDIMNRESGEFAWQAGLKIGYDIGKVTLYTGLYYNNYSYDIKPTFLTAQTLDNGTLGYSIVTSSGIINLDCSNTSSSTGGVTHKGDSLKIHGSTTRGYVCIPLQLQYLFASYKKVGFFAEAGISANIASYTSTTINWQDSRFEEGNVSVNSIQGLQKVQFGYSIGVGANYSLSKHFLIYINPILRGSITSVSKNTPVSSYPLFLGCTAGLSYHF